MQPQRSTSLVFRLHDLLKSPIEINLKRSPHQVASLVEEAQILIPIMIRKSQ